MAAPGHNGGSYEEALAALSSLRMKRNHADNSEKGDRFEILFDYLKILELEEEDMLNMKVIHVAGTKGKVVIFNVEGYMYSVLVGNTFGVAERTNEEIPMPTYFRFLTSLAFKIFAAEKVDVAILEVGLGGRLDSTNSVRKPVVCGVSPPGYDHMEILGDTLGKIAGEKAGIFKLGVPPFTVPQPDEAMRVLEEKASQLNVNLQVVQPLTARHLSGQKLGLDGEHQYLNAGLAVSLASTWLQQVDKLEVPSLTQKSILPEKFIRGLATASLQGRGQVVSDQFIESRTSGEIVFYLDGAHTPESMEFSGEDNCQQVRGREVSCFVLDKRFNGLRADGFFADIVVQLHVSVHFKKALFVPNMVYHKVGTAADLPENDPQVDLSWQLTLQKVWESLVHSEIEGEEDGESSGNNEVFTSLPMAIKWLRDSVHESGSATHFQVLVTGSLHLVGDVLRLIRK
ncbi:hypothetical protein F2Q69_00000245 [Brassica cretica]|uniref:Folylpolyglutamate synthase n=1 Tax=Brassica cretica TaxID=69181 RepID=A0A8S9P8G7_BRACR|nr:hypothetical protein F2Q69_00000245 [Brassica cretica]